jgi:ribulose-5-phosphate 4-epimerase/fuculose-1-phosphate aldolase
VLPFGLVKGARLRRVCHMCGFLGEVPPVFEIRDSAGPDIELLISGRELGAALACTQGLAPVVLMRGHGCTVVAESVRVAVYRAVCTDLNARVLLQALPLGAVEPLTPQEAEATRITNEGLVDRP